MAIPNFLGESSKLSDKSDDLSQYSLRILTCNDALESQGFPTNMRELVNPSILQEYRGFSNHVGDFPLFFYLVDLKENICSYFRVIPDEVVVEGVSYPWAWTCDNFTEPESRGRGLSTYLQKLATQYLHDRGLGRGSVSSTDVTLHIFSKLGFHLAGYAKRHILVRSLDPILRAHLRREWTRNLTSTIARPCAMTLGSFVRTWNRSRRVDTSCERVTDSSWEEFLSVIDRTIARREIHFKSDTTSLDKKLELARRKSDLSAYLIRNSKGQAIASLVVREQFQNEPLSERYFGFRRITLMHHAMDLHDSTAASALIGHLIEIFYRSGAEVLDLVSNDQILNHVAARSGLIAVGKGMSFAYSIPRAWRWPSMTNDFHNWPITCMCGDAYTF